MEAYDPMTEPWDCWRCGGKHARRHPRCPNGGVSDAPPSRVEMALRLNRFCERYAEGCEARGDSRRLHVRHVGDVPMADAVRMLKELQPNHEGPDTGKESNT